MSKKFEININLQNYYILGNIEIQKVVLCCKKNIIDFVLLD